MSASIIHLSPNYIIYSKDLIELWKLIMLTAMLEMTPASSDTEVQWKLPPLNSCGGIVCGYKLVRPANA